MRNRRTWPVRFRWIDWNRDKIANHGLSPEEVEFAWRRSLGQLRKRSGGTFENIGRIPSGRQILIAWKWDEVLDAWALEGVSRVVFVITAYEIKA
jgi:hypothetical protein